jgi:uncharacterized glyoxalase superfamily protein PhnB
MPERSPVERLEAMLRELPRDEFRMRLKSELGKEARMSTAAAIPSVVPYLSVVEAPELGDFVAKVFGAEGGVLGTGSQGGTHGQYYVGDAMVMIGGGPGWRNPQPRLAMLHVYVGDADAAYQRAVAAGARSLYPPDDKPYGDREAGVQDVAGNLWFIGTLRGRPRPEGLRSVTLGFLVQSGADFIRFLRDAFAAEEVMRHTGPEGQVLHAQVRIGDTIVEIGEAREAWKGLPTSVFLTLDDCDRAYERAVSAGAEPVTPPGMTPYGQRAATVRDAAGNLWYIHGQAAK